MVGEPNIGGASGRKRAGVGSAVRAKPVLSEAARVLADRSVPGRRHEGTASTASEPRRSPAEWRKRKRLAAAGPARKADDPEGRNEPGEALQGGVGASREVW
jgi:hypothetical protein